MIVQISYLFTGVFAGILAGLLGVGGGIVVVPVLDILFSSLFPPNLLMHMAIGTSLAIMIFTTASTTYNYQRKGLVNWSLFYQFTPGMFLGAITGTWIAKYLSSDTLRIAFAIFLLIIAVKMFDTRKVHTEKQLPSFLIISMVAFCTGMISGFFGVGGGSLMVPFFVYYNVIMQNATATSSACGFILAIIGTICLIITGLSVASISNVPAGTTGFVYWPAVFPVALTSVIFAPIGTRLAIWLPANILQRIFAVIIIFTAIYLFKQSY